MKESFILHTTQYKVLRKLTVEQKGRLFDAVFQHALGEEFDLSDDPVLELAYEFVAERMISDSEKYEQICERRRENGKKGGIAKATKNKQKVANVANAKFAKQNKQKVANVADTDTDTDTDNLEAVPKGTNASMSYMRFDPSSSDWPPGLTHDEWVRFSKWLIRENPILKDVMTPLTYMTFKGWTNYQTELVCTILLELDTTADLMENYKRHLYNHAEELRIWN